jgi:hypothetical protein
VSETDLKLTDHELRRLGASLREIDPLALQSDPTEGRPRWFQGDRGVELFAWSRFGRVDHAQLILGRTSVEWSERSGLSVGQLSDTCAPLGGRYDAYLVFPSDRLDPLLCRAALHVLRASPLAAEVVAPFVTALEARGIP